jgi:molybdate transport system ATP-binding protein
MASEVIAAATIRYPSGATVHLDLAFPIQPAGVTVLFGPSGSGKSSMLRALAGLERPAAGTIRFGGDLWVDSAAGAWVTPQARRVGYMFQDYALFPTYTVAGNIAYGLGALTASEREERVRETVRLLHLDGLEARKPGELSGGQQQRVALARAIATRPRLLLLDEPLSALDAPTRVQLRTELRRLLRELAVPSVVVTHDWEEALALGDRIAIVREGRVIQTGTPESVFNAPKDVEVAKIVGMETVVPGRCLGIKDGMAEVEAGGRVLRALVQQDPGPDVFACIRAEDVIIERADAAATSARNHLAGTIRSATPMGALVCLEVDCGFRLTAIVTRMAADDLSLQVGTPVIAAVKAGAVHLVPR